MRSLNKLKEELLLYYCRAYEEHLMAGTSGNASIFILEQGKMLITPSGVDYRGLTPEDLVLCDLTGRPESEQAEQLPSSEWRLHAAIYRTVTGANAVLHTHSPYATAFAACAKPIPRILIEMDPFLGGEVPVCPYAPAGSEALAQGAAAMLRQKPACLLQNHGVVAVGEKMERAYLRAAYVEDAAKICALARTVGEPLLLPDLIRTN